MRLLSALLLLTALPAGAALASPAEPGTPAGEPTASFAGLRVVREALTLDLRPLGSGRPFGLVEATYRVVNAGGARTVPLEFLALGGADRAEVWLDGRPVEGERVDGLAVPALWAIAESTPALDDEPAPYETDDGFGTPSGRRFAVALAAGQHTVRVRYPVRLGAFDAGAHPNRVWQLGYSLAPARLWAGFGQLDVAVLVPDGWDAAASLPLRREGGRLVGRFPGVPADVLAVSVRAPAPTARGPLRAAGWLTALLVVVGAGYVLGRLAAQSGRRGWATLPGAGLAGVVATVAWVILLSVADDLGDSDAFGYATARQLIFVAGPVALVATTALAQLVALVTRRRYLERPGPPR